MILNLIAYLWQGGGGGVGGGTGPDARRVHQGNLSIYESNTLLHFGPLYHTLGLFRVVRSMVLILVGNSLNVAQA